jgi:hypothetical protein
MKVRVKDEKLREGLIGSAGILPLQAFRMGGNKIYMNMPDGSLRRLNKKFRGRRAKSREANTDFALSLLAKRTYQTPKAKTTEVTP